MEVIYLQKTGDYDPGIVIRLISCFSAVPWRATHSSIDRISQRLRWSNQGIQGRIPPLRVMNVPSSRVWICACLVSLRPRRQSGVGVDTSVPLLSLGFSGGVTSQALMTSPIVPPHDVDTRGMQPLSLRVTGSDLLTPSRGPEPWRNSL